MFKLCSIVFLLIASIHAKSQQLSSIALEGRVKSSFGSSASYASVNIKEKISSTDGTVCDVDGKFHFEGVKINDTINFTSIGLKPVYLVVGKLYNYLDITMEVDTVKTIFADNDYKLKFQYYPPLQLSNTNGNFGETDKVVKREQVDSNKLKNKLLLKIVVSPSINSKSVVYFFDSLQHYIKGATQKRKDKNINVKIYYSITQEGTVQVTLLEGNCNEETKTIITKIFETIVKAGYGIQNGKFSSAFCSLSFKINLKGEEPIITLNTP